MIRKFIGITFSIVLSLAVTGCNSLSKKAEEVLPTHDEVLYFNLSYDLTFLRTMEALESMSGWELVETEKEKGIIVVRNDDFEGFDDREKRFADFVVTRVDPRTTSVKLEKQSQHVIGGDDMLKAINKYVSREL